MMNRIKTQSRQGFTLVEILVVIAIIAILAALLLPMADKAMLAAQKRRAATEMQSIKVAILQFQSEHRYMPWTDANKVGDDKWVISEADQKALMNLLVGNNPMKKTYLQIPEKSRPADGALLFLAPWSDKKKDYEFYIIGMDRNSDGAVMVDNSSDCWAGQTVMERVLVYPMGDPSKDCKKRLKTFDVME